MSDDPTDSDDAASGADRLEQALERIAALAARRPAVGPASDTAEVAARLDQLIAQLRATLSHNAS